MSSGMANWRAGADTRGFAVDAGTPMEGYAARTGPSIGTADELEVGALVLSHGDQRLVVVTADVAAVDAALVTDIAARARIARSELVVCASHTHSGPAGIVPNLHPSDIDRTDQAVRDAFIATCVAAIEGARARIENVELLFGRSDTTGLAANRNGPTGPYDSRVSVLATRTMSGYVCAVLVHFACHPTILGADNRRISADFPGALRRALGASLRDADHAPAILFANGAAGDVSTRYTRKGQDRAEVERVGTALAAAAVKALDNARIVHGPIRYDRKTVVVSPRSLDEQAAPRSGANDDGSRTLTGAEQRRAETRQQGADLLSALMARGPRQIQSRFDVETWALGDLVIVAVPGELFASLGGDIAGASSSPTLVLGYANGYVGYLADKGAYARGTYEALASPFAAGAGECVGDAARELSEKLREGAPRDDSST